MFQSILISELKSNIRQPLLYVFILIFISFTWFITIHTGTVGLSGFWLNNVNNNSPYALTGIYATLSLLSLFVSISFASGTALKDFKTHYYEILFTTSIKKRDYFFGRFIAANILSIIPFFFILPASFLAAKISTHDKIGTFLFLPHFTNFLIFVVPNTILTSSVFFSIAIIKKKLIYPFVSCIIILTLYSLSIGLFSNIDNHQLINIIDPLGINATQLLTRFWSLAEKNSIVIALNGGLLMNRILWVSIGLGILYVIYKRFSLSIPQQTIKQKKVKEDLDLKEKKQTIINKNHDYNKVYNNYFNQIFSQVKIDFFFIIKSLGFKIILIIALLSLIIPAFLFSDTFYGTPSYPITYKMIEMIRSTLSLMILFVIIVYYSGELLHKEKDAGFNLINDALATPNWVFFTSKVITLSLLSIFVLSTYMLGTILVQLSDGYTNLELILYFKELILIEFTYYLMVIIVAILFQILTDNKYIGMFLTFILFFAINNLEIEHFLLKFAGSPTHIYSDFNGFGRHAEVIIHYKIYWGIFCCLLLFISQKLWKRGFTFGFIQNLKFSFKNFHSKDYLIITFISAVFIIYGSYIFYNTNILNNYESKKSVYFRKSEYEKKYKKYEFVTQPKITDIELEVNIFPHKNKVEVSGKYILKNKTNDNIDTIFISSLPYDNKNGWLLSKMDIHNSNITFNDQELGFQKYKLNTPLIPGDSTVMEFSMIYEVRGFENDISYVRISENGSFVDLNDFSPHLGYFSRSEIFDKNVRSKFNLPKHKGLPTISDSSSLNYSLYQNNADWVKYSCVISTSDDQIAIAPGSLKKKWTSNKRNYYRYSFDVPVVNFFSFISGKYEVKREKWNDVDIEIYYLPKHYFNVDKMIKSAKSTLQYCSENFYPYPYKQARIIEFPKYAKFAQAFPGTMPYSESIGFIADLRNENDIDQVNFVVSHEIAHQWWGGMLVGANVKGVTVMSESMAQYVALMVMEKDFGKDHIGKFLKYELDKYLSKRSKAFSEDPLIYNETQPYIHYNKGALVMYNIKEIVGEITLNNSLKEYFNKASYRSNPYTTSNEFIEYISKIVPDSLQYVVKDLFYDITIYNNSTKQATFKKLDNGKFLVNLEIECSKFKADKNGNEKKVDLNDWFDIGVYSKEEGIINLIYCQKIKIDKSFNSIELIVDQKPYKAGIDPKYLLIDKKTDDNMVKVEELKNY